MPSQRDFDESEDDFVILESDLPSRQKPSNNVFDSIPRVSVDLQSINGSNKTLLTIRPPTKPDAELKRVSCDIVLVIDVSGSMNAAAELPDQASSEKKESSGLSILDLVKHASRTILEKLEDGDRLAVVTFSREARIIQELLPMTTSEKKATWKRIDELGVHDSTNLWAGLREGLSIINDTASVGNVQQMLVLTDGVPNHMCPSQGYVKKLQPMLRKMQDDKGCALTINTFGFGYYLRSGLLRSIAEVGRGSFAFCPDSGMLGTVFVHAIANLFSTFATNVAVTLRCSSTNTTICLPSYLELDVETQNGSTKLLHFGNVQYGQSRDVVITLEGALDIGKDELEATLHYDIPKQTRQSITVKCNANTPTKVPQTTINYHLSRHDLCNFLSGLSVKTVHGEHAALSASLIPSHVSKLPGLIAKIEGRISTSLKVDPTADITNISALLADLKSSASNDPHGAGQISLALQTETPVTPPGSRHAHHYRSYVPSFYSRWGTHYLPSILQAHMRQICTTFKDPGPLCYGKHSPMFIKFRDELDEAFDKLPAPKPTLRHYEPRGTQGPNATQVTNLRMARYNCVGNPCFAGECEVKCYDGSEMRKVEELRIGDIVWTPKGGRMVRQIVKTDIQRAGGSQVLCNIRGVDGLWITPFHPAFIDGRWIFPEELGGPTKVIEEGSVYSVMLEEDEDMDAHAIEVGGVLCVTLGHGLTTLCQDIRGHWFFGDYELVKTSLETLEKDNCGRWICGGVRKNRVGVVEAFLRPQSTGVDVEG